MRTAETDSAILRFFRDDVGGIMITGENGEVLYADGKAGFVQREKTNWQAACPPARPDQKGETWDLLNSDSGRTYMVTTSTFTEDGRVKQIHHLADTSLYMGMYRDISDYSKRLRAEKEYDRMTGLFNKGKFMEMERDLFRKLDTIAVFNMDVNNLKQINDSFGHEAGDRLIRKAAESLKRIEARNILPFRVGGDEFVVVAIHVSREEAEKIRKKWEKELAELNSLDDGIQCTVACGFAYGEQGFDPDEVFARADRLMYEDKKNRKRQAQQPLTAE